MQRRAVLAGMGAVMATGKVEAADDPLRQAVMAFLQAQEDAWNAADAKAMFDWATPDIHWVNVVGMHWRGREEVERAHRIYFDIMFRGVPKKLVEIERLTALTPEVAVCVACWRVGAYRTPGGQTRPEALDRTSFTLVGPPDRLRMAHVANIEVVAEAQIHDPIRGRGA